MNSVSRQELAAGMAAGQFSAQESSLVFDLADSNGDGEDEEDSDSALFRIIVMSSQLCLR